MKRVLFTILIIAFFLFVGYKTFERNADFIDIVKDSYALEYRTVGSKKSISQGFFYFNIQKELFEVSHSVYQKKYRDAMEHIDSLIQKLDTFPRAQKDMRYYDTYLRVFEYISDPIQTIQKEHNVSYGVAFDDELFYIIIDNHRRIYKEALGSYNLSSELITSYSDRLDRYHKAMIKAFRRSSNHQLQEMLKIDQVNTQPSRVVRLIFEEMLKTLHLDKIVETR
ncbi:MAG: hypothetical protein U9N49_06635, partial [Campylobacterota bacterium]|nr:hypothetical protein [Campylobacterota bacterium]